MRKLVATLAVVGSALVAAVSGQTPATPALKVGDKAPDFSLPGSDGKTHTLSQYKGHYVVLAWFPKAFTGG